jgi:hypothetical protein
MRCEMVMATKTVRWLTAASLWGVIHLPAIVQSEESLRQSFPFFWNLQSRTRGRLPVEHRF